VITVTPFGAVYHYVPVRGRFVSMNHDKSTAADRVKVAIDVFVPRKFVGHDLVDVGSVEMAAKVSAWCTMVDGRVAYGAVVFDPPLVNPGEVDWADLSDRLLYDAGLALRLGNDANGADLVGIDEFVGRLETAAGEQRTYNRMTFGDYERVLELADEGGPDAVSAEFHVGRRQANRYIRDAKAKVQR
jgi:hypothetical protein